MAELIKRLLIAVYWEGGYDGGQGSQGTGMTGKSIPTARSALTGR